MITTSGFRNLWRKVVVLEEGWRHSDSERREMPLCLWDSMLDSSYCHNLSKGNFSSSPLQEMSSLQAWGCWTQIKAFILAVWFGQLLCIFKKWNSAYWGRRNSCFGQWMYFGFWRDDFSVELAENGSSDGKESFWYIGVRRTYCSVILQNLQFAKLKNYSPN